MPLLRPLRFLFMLLLLATLLRSLMLEQSAPLTSGLAACIGWWSGGLIRAQGQLACQIARAVLMALSLAVGMALASRPELEVPLLTYCGFATGLMIALTSPRGGGRRPRRARLQQPSQVFSAAALFPAAALSHRPLRSASEMVRFR